MNVVKSEKNYNKFLNIDLLRFIKKTFIILTEININFNQKPAYHLKRMDL